jgi:hypothetical protein
LGATVADVFKGRLQACPGSFEAPHLGSKLDPRGVLPPHDLHHGVTTPGIHGSTLSGTISR